MAEPQGATTMGSGDASSEKPRRLTLALAVHALAVPLMILSIAAATGASLPPLLLALWLSLAILGPCGAVIARVWRERSPAVLRPAGEVRDSLARLLLTGLVLAYLVALGISRVDGVRLMPLLALALSANLYAWLVRTEVMLGPALGPWRTWAVLVIDLVCLSIFLHAGGALAVPCVALYFAAIFGFGARFGPSALAGAALLSLVGFGAVWAGTAYWRAQPELAGAVALALVLLPGCAATLAPRLADATASATALVSREWQGRPADAPDVASGEMTEAMARGALLSGPARPLRILVAEGSDADRVILRRILESAGHHITMVAHGDAALAALEQNRFELALIDVELARAGGCEVSKLYRLEHLGERRLPMIALAADPGIEIERQCREAGMDAVLAKPIEPTRLLAAIDATHARMSAGPEAERGPVGATPIAARPRHFADAGAIVDEATIEALRSLGGRSNFLDDVIDTFCSEGRRLLEQLRQAVAEGDLDTFRQLVNSLRSSAGNVGAARLYQVLTELRDITALDLTRDPAANIGKILSEFAKLETALGRIAREGRIG
jgi:CheY-like chemotaxis protein